MCTTRDDNYERGCFYDELYSKTLTTSETWPIDERENYDFDSRNEYRPAKETIYDRLYYPNSDNSHCPQDMHSTHSGSMYNSKPRQQNHLNNNYKYFPSRDFHRPVITYDSHHPGNYNAPAEEFHPHRLDKNYLRYKILQKKYAKYYSEKEVLHINRFGESFRRRKEYPENRVSRVLTPQISIERQSKDKTRGRDARSRGRKDASRYPAYRELTPVRQAHLDRKQSYKSESISESNGDPSLRSKVVHYSKNEQSRESRSKSESLSPSPSKRKTEKHITHDKKTQERDKHNHYSQSTNELEYSKTMIRSSVVLNETKNMYLRKNTNVYENTNEGKSQFLETSFSTLSQISTTNSNSKEKTQSKNYNKSISLNPTIMHSSPLKNMSSNHSSTQSTSECQNKSKTVSSPLSEHNCTEPPETSQRTYQMEVNSSDKPSSFDKKDNNNTSFCQQTNSDKLILNKIQTSTDFDSLDSQESRYSNTNIGCKENHFVNHSQNRNIKGDLKIKIKLNPVTGLPSIEVGQDIIPGFTSVNSLSKETPIDNSNKNLTSSQNCQVVEDFECPLETSNNESTSLNFKCKKRNQALEFSSKQTAPITDPKAIHKNKDLEGDTDISTNIIELDQLRDYCLMGHPFKLRNCSINLKALTWTCYCTKCRVHYKTVLKPPSIKS